MEYQLIQYTNFDRFKYFGEYYRLPQYVYTHPKKPTNLVIINQPFSDEFLIDNLDAITIYLYTDGSIQNGVGGYGVHIEVIRPNTITNNLQYKMSTVIDEIRSFIGICNDINYVEFLRYIKHYIV